MYTVTLEQFNGPLGLLLELIEGEELDITRISLASVADQFMAYLEQSSVKNPEELADFLVIATKLLVIKSKTLFPDLALGEEGDIPLEVQLGIYRHYRDASVQLENRIKQKQWAYFRDTPTLVRSFSPPPALTSGILCAVWKRVLGALEQMVELPKAAIIKTITLAERIREIQNLLVGKATVSFGRLKANAKNKTEVIINFLAILELAKRQLVRLDQSHLFEDITITHHGYESTITT